MVSTAICKIQFYQLYFLFHRNIITEELKTGDTIMPQTNISAVLAVFLVVQYFSISTTVPHFMERDIWGFC